MRNKKLKIVTIGGGSGQYILLTGLRDLPGIDITAIVSMVDSGGSTGRLRDEYGVLPPGDILKCVLALSPLRVAARKILQKKFVSRSRLNGHNAGNMLLTILSQYAGSFPEGVNALGEVLSISGRVLPVTTDKATLVAELADGSHLYGETVIDLPKTERRKKIMKTFLVPHHQEKINVYPPVIDAIKAANFIIIGPGDLYTSITPNFLVNGVAESIKKTKAKIIFIINIMTKFGETDNFTATDFILNLEKFINRPVDIVILNSGEPQSDIMHEYTRQKARLVKIDVGDSWGKRRIIKENLLNTGGDIARHDSQRLAQVIKQIIRKKHGRHF